MKKKKILALVCICVCLISLAAPAFASEVRASDQIRSYRLDTVVTEGAVHVEFSITGKYIMDKIGCQSIFLYEKVGSSWKLIAEKDEDDYGMSNTNKINHANTITFAGTAGVEYKVVVTVFAKNSAGRDSRAQIFYVTGK
ncbi:MAG: hypothetical protein HFF52_06310 [Lawsonibacter sp.]|nr:hypothetical protein [Lawsonibacter sp.]